MPEPPTHLTDLPEAVYLPVGDGRFEPTAWARGPWDPNAQHAGPVAAVLGHAMERHDLGDADPSSVLLARCTVDLVRPVPLTPLDVEVRTTRQGRRAHWMDAVLRADGREVARATGLRLPSVPLELPEHPAPPDTPPPGPEGVEPIPRDDESHHLFFWHAVDVLPLTPNEPGPGTAWFRLRVPLVAGFTTTPLMRVLAAADFTLGISRVLAIDEFAFPNADLTLHLHRLPASEWVCLDGTSRVEPRGSGTAEATLYDERGRLGAALQSLVLAARDTTAPG